MADSVTRTISTVICFMASAVAWCAPSISDEQLFELSLSELGNISVMGAAVRNLNLTTTPYTNNPHKLSNYQLTSFTEVVDSKTIEARGLKNVVEVVQSMVGVLSGESPSEPYSFSTRGFSRNSINVLYDGISMGMSTLNMRPQNTFNLERVEFVKGASALSGEEGAAGGTVNIITKKPIINQPTTLDALAIVGSYNSLSSNLAYATSPTVSSAYRLDVNHNASDGWVSDTPSESLNMTSGAVFTPQENLKLSMSLNYLEDNLPSYWGTPLIPAAAASQANTSVVSAMNDKVIDEALRFVNYNVSDNQISSASLWSRFDINFKLASNSALDASFYQYHADRTWKNAETYNYDTTTSLVQRDRLLIDHERYIRGASLAFNQTFVQNGYTHKLALKYENSVNDFTRTVGFDLNAADFYNIDAVSLTNPSSGTFGNYDTRYDKQTRIMDSLIIDYRIIVSDKLSVNTAIKHEHILFDRQYIQFDGAIRQRKTLDKTFDQQRYNVGVAYELSPEHNLFAQYSFSHDPIEEDLKFFYDLSNFTPSDVVQYEMGIKSDFNSKRTQSTLVIYDLEKKQTVQEALGSAFTQNIQNSQGLELALKHEINEKLLIGGNLAYTDAQYGNYYDADTGNDVSNNTPINVPTSMLSTWLNYKHAFNLPLEFGVGINRVDKRYSDSSNLIELKPYQLINIFAAYELKDYRVGFSVHNLTDEIYAPWSDAFYPNQVALGAPRTYEVSLRARF